MIIKKIHAIPQTINRRYRRSIKKLPGKIKEKSPIISEPGITPDVLSSRGGLNLFARYIRSIGLGNRLETLFGSIKKSRKGQPVIEMFKQLLNRVTQ